MVVETAEIVEATKESAASMGIRTAETIVQTIVLRDANALAASVLKDENVLAMTEQILIEEAVVVSAEATTAAGVVQAEALERVLVLAEAATVNPKLAVVTQKGNRAVQEETVEVSRRKHTLDSKN